MQAASCRALEPTVPGTSHVARCVLHVALHFAVTWFTWFTPYVARCMLHADGEMWVAPTILPGEFAIPIVSIKCAPL